MLRRRYTAPAMRTFPAILPTSQTLSALPGGVAGVETTVRAMRDMVRAGKVDPRVRHAALSIVHLTPPKMHLHEARAVFEWVRDCITYRRDIHDVETLCAPWVTLATQVGDCDDQVTLLCALLESIGLPTRFVLTAHHAPGELEHVTAEVFADDAWHAMDPTEPVPFGWAPPDALTVARERVEGVDHAF